MTTSTIVLAAMACRRPVCHRRPTQPRPIDPPQIPAAAALESKRLQLAMLWVEDEIGVRQEFGLLAEIM